METERTTNFLITAAALLLSLRMLGFIIYCNLYTHYHTHRDFNIFISNGISNIILIIDKIDLLQSYSRPTLTEHTQANVTLPLPLPLFGMMREMLFS